MGCGYFICTGLLTGKSRPVAFEKLQEIHNTRGPSCQRFSNDLVKEYKKKTAIIFYQALYRSSFNGEIARLKSKETLLRTEFDNLLHLHSS